MANLGNSVINGNLRVNGEILGGDVVKNVDISGKTVTVTKSDGTTKTLSTQDTTYSLPTASSSTLGGVKTGNNITNSSGTISITKDNVTSALGYTPPTTNTTYSVATTSANGLMSSTDKSKLDGIAAGAQVNTITGIKGNSETSYRTGNVNITAANIGLGNVNNTADSVKSVASAAKVTNALTIDNVTYDGSSAKTVGNTNRYVTLEVAQSASLSNGNCKPVLWKANLGLTPYDGMQISFKLPSAGHDYGVFVSLNNGTNYYPLNLGSQDNSRLTTQYASGRIITAIYSSTARTDSVFAIAGATARSNITGSFVIQSQCRDGNNINTIREENGRVIAGTNGIMPYTIIALDNANRYQSLTLSTNAGTGTSKTMNTSAKFKLAPVLRYYGANDTTTNGNTVPSTYYVFSIQLIDTRYSHNHTKTFAANTPTYIECDIADGYWSPTSVGITQTFTIGKYYIFLGNSCNTEYQVSLAADHPVYYYDGTNLTDYTNQLYAKKDEIGGAGGLSIDLPIGSVISYAGTTPPSGYLLCDGSAVSRTTYAELFSTIGTTYGAGDGSTTFNVPDLKDKFVLGKGEKDLGATGGEATHTLTTAEMPKHIHSFTGTAHGHTFTGTKVTTTSNGNHSHTYTKTTNTYANNFDRTFTGYGVDSYNSSNTDTNSTGAHTHDVTASGTISNTTAGGTIGETGGNGAHNNMPPYIVQTYIIKAKNDTGVLDTTQAKVIDGLTSTSTTDALSAAQGKILKELVDTKSNEVVDNLISTSTVDALSAAQGKKLKEMIEKKSDTPIGTITPYAGSTAPTGYLICDGSAVSRATYKDLFAVIGTIYGSGDGSTTFNVPNLKDKFILGLGNRALGTTGGEETHTLTINEMPSHTHIQNAHNHTANVMQSSYAAGSFESMRGVNLGSKHNGSYTIPYTSSTAATNQNTGGGAAHNNMPPYLVQTYIIKATNISSTVDSSAINIEDIKQQIITEAIAQLTKKKYVELSLVTDWQTKLGSTPVHFKYDNVKINSSSSDFSIDSVGNVTITGDGIHHIKVQTTVQKNHDNNGDDYLMYFLRRKRNGNITGYSKIVTDVKSWAHGTLQAIIEVQKGDIIDVAVISGNANTTVAFPIYSDFAYGSGCACNTFYLEVLD